MMSTRKIRLVACAMEMFANGGLWGGGPPAKGSKRESQQSVDAQPTVRNDEVMVCVCGL